MNTVDSHLDGSSTAAGGTRIQSVARACQLLLWVADQPGGATAKEVAFANRLTLSTTYHLLNTLVLNAIRELADVTHEQVWLADWGDLEIRVLASVDGREPSPVTKMIGRPYADGHARAGGKLLLAYALPHAREEYIRRYPLRRAAGRGRPDRREHRHRHQYGSLRSRARGPYRCGRGGRGRDPRGPLRLRRRR